MKKTLLAVLSLAITIPALADDIRLGRPEYGGNGCPAGSASVSLTPDAKSLSILFDQFQVESGGTTGKTIDRKSCNVAIPVHVPQGFSVSIFEVDYRGFNAIPNGGLAQFQAEYFFAGGRGPVYRQNFTGPLAQDYLISNRLQATATVWSPCGQDVILRTNASMTNRTNRFGEQALSTVDSVDIRSGIVYQLQWRRCN